MRTLSLLLTACVLAGCVKVATNPATGRTDVDVEPPTKHGEDWSGTLAGQGMHAAVTGEVKALNNEGVTTVTVSLSGLPAGAAMPWHVHEGKCGSGGPIVGDPGAYPPLSAGQDGRATGNATINVTLNEAKDYYVNVHASASDLATIVACGDLDD